jgi:tetratricopeptide (TPR) repeat protein
MKLYFHFDDCSLPAFTKIIHVEEGETLRGVISSFLDYYTSKHGVKIDVSHIFVSRDSVKKELKLDSRCKVLGLKEKDDVHVKRSPENKKAEVKDLYSSIREEAMAKAEQLMAERNLRGARAIYQRILEVDTGIDNVKALCQLSRIWLDAGKGDNALELAQKALGLSAKGRSLPLQLIGEAYLILGHHELAVTHLQESETKEAAFILAKALHEYAVSLAPTDELYSQQLHQRCSGHVMGIVEKDSDSWEGLFWYSQLALDQGLVEDSIRVALRLLVRRKDSTDIKHLLADGVSSPDGLEILIRELP